MQELAICNVMSIIGRENYAMVDGIRIDLTKEVNSEINYELDEFYQGLEELQCLSRESSN